MSVFGPVQERICLNYFDQKNNFIFVTVNGDRVKLYNNDKLTIFDAAVQYGLPNEHIFPKRGEDLTFKINGKKRIVRGYNGEAAVIKRNDVVVGMNTLIEANDKIDIAFPSNFEENELSPFIETLISSTLYNSFSIWKKFLLF